MVGSTGCGQQKPICGVGSKRDGTTWIEGKSPIVLLLELGEFSDPTELPGNDPPLSVKNPTEATVPAVVS